MEFEDTLEIYNEENEEYFNVVVTFTFCEGSPATWGYSGGEPPEDAEVEVMGIHLEKDHRILFDEEDVFFVPWYLDKGEIPPDWKHNRDDWAEKAIDTARLIIQCV